MKKLTLSLVAAGLLALTLGSSLACTSTLPRRNPVGEAFPSVRGEDLAGKERQIPEEFAGAPVALLIGYVQKTQFDLDRWLLGLAQADAGLAVLELPTVRGLVPRLISGTIDSGMRSGIPEEDWRSVVTLYSDSAPVAELTGTENPRNTRVVLLDGAGRVIWFHDRGYSAGKLLELLEAAAQAQERSSSK